MFYKKYVIKPIKYNVKTRLNMVNGERDSGKNQKSVRNEIKSLRNPNFRFVQEKNNEKVETKVLACFQHSTQ